MDGGAWWAAVHEVAKSRTRLSDFTFTFHFYALEKEMATHSSVLVWRIPGMGELGGLPSMGSHRVGHDCSDLAAAAAAYCMYFIDKSHISSPKPVIAPHCHSPLLQSPHSSHIAAPLHAASIAQRPFVLFSTLHIPTCLLKSSPNANHIHTHAHARTHTHTHTHSFSDSFP